MVLTQQVPYIAFELGTRSGNCRLSVAAQEKRNVREIEQASDDTRRYREYDSAMNKLSYGLACNIRPQNLRQCK